MRVRCAGERSECVRAGFRFAEGRRVNEPFHARSTKSPNLARHAPRSPVWRASVICGRPVIVDPPGVSYPRTCSGVAVRGRLFKNYSTTQMRTLCE